MLRRFTSLAPIIAVALLSAPGLAEAPALWPKLVAPPRPAAVAPRSEDAALLIAIDRYQNPAFAPIPGAEDNASDWHDWLQTTMGVRPERMKDLYRENARSWDIKAEARKYAAKVGRGGRLWVVFVGHGAPTRSAGGGEMEGGLVGWEAGDTEPSFYGATVPLSDLQREVKAGLSAQGASAVFVLDACFSGRTESGTVLPGGVMATVPAHLLSEAADEGRFTVLSAASASQTAGPLPGAPRPAFSYLLLGALLGWGEWNGGDGVVRASEATDWVRVAIEGARRGRNLQEPQWAGADVVLGGGKAEGPDPRAIGKALAEEPTPALPWKDLLALLQKEEEADRQAKEAREARTRATEEALAQGSEQITKEADREWKGIAGKLSEESGPGVQAVVGHYIEKYGSASVTAGSERRAVTVPWVKEARAWVERWTRGRSGGTDWTSPTLGVMKWIPPGSFKMGCVKGRDDVAGGCVTDESPVDVTISRGFLLMEHEVTQGEWTAVMGANPSSFKGCPKCPVEAVGWDDVRSSVSKVSTRDKVTYRLPTEAEWEWAARGGATWPFAGSDEAGLGSVAWYEANSGSKTHEVCTAPRARVGYGLCDMSGNVWEWVEDAYAATLPGGQDPVEKWFSTSNYRVGRGGSWFDSAWFARVAIRRRSEPGSRSGLLGFRLARSVP